MPTSRRDEALDLTEEILTDIELSRTPVSSFPRKVARLARLIDDTDMMRRVGFEVSGYLLQANGSWGPAEWEACLYFRRGSFRDDGQLAAYGTTLGQIEAELAVASARMAAASDPPTSLTSANPNQFVSAPKSNATERQAVATHIANLTGLRDRVVGRLHQYVAEKHYELRFGSATESAFGVVRARVDDQIGRVVPDALQMLAGAFEASTSDNPEQWSHAASTCRRLIKAVADALRPPGEPVGGRLMDSNSYVNRIVDWIERHSDSRTSATLASTELRHLGERLDAVVGAGTKGAHAVVSRYEASRFLAGTYLLLGDILEIQDGTASLEPNQDLVEPTAGVAYSARDSPVEAPAEHEKIDQ